MGRFFALALDANVIQPKIKAKRTSNQKTNWGLWMAVALVASSIFYLVQINNLTTKGYEIKRLEKTVLELKESQKRLERESASLQSVARIEESAKILNLIPSKEVKYPDKNGFAYEDVQFQ
ncbi:MAG: septum formation initiator family protein [bacterium]|nr:septum formation initiator family protein [bacterium]